MNSENSNNLINAVLAGDFDAVKHYLSLGASPDAVHSWPIIIHAAQFAKLDIFRELLKFAAIVPDFILKEIISWELGDWILDSDEDVSNFSEIILLLRDTNAWLSLDERINLADCLKSYNLESVRKALIPEQYEN